MRCLWRSTSELSRFAVPVAIGNEEDEFAALALGGAGGASVPCWFCGDEVASVWARDEDAWASLLSGAGELIVVGGEPGVEEESGEEECGGECGDFESAADGHGSGSKEAGSKEAGGKEARKQEARSLRSG